MQSVGPGSKSLPCYSLDLFLVALSLIYLATLTLEIALSLIILVIGLSIGPEKPPWHSSQLN